MRLLMLLLLTGLAWKLPACPSERPPSIRPFLGD
jgi:hypothetical protein